MTTADNPDFEALLDYLKRTRGFDFTAYKRPSLMRRIQKRMQTLSVPTYADYQDYLEVHPDEFPHLFNTILINVTSFFRDRPAWEYLADAVIPRILADNRPDEAVRVWSAGCASGEEAYSLAMLLAEALGFDAFRARVKIYASNVDEAALNRARLASYTPKEVEEVPAEMRAKYFELVGDRYVFHKELRRSVIFGRHDLIQDAPISRIDLLVCRNTLMYFNAEVQARILARFHFALNDGGFLFLGKAEMLLAHQGTFTPVDIKRRFFAKVSRANLRDRLLVMAQAGRDEPPGNNLINHVRIREAAFNTDPAAQLVIDVAGSLVLANDPARALFALTSRDLGRPAQELDFYYRPVELRPFIDRAYAERHPLAIRDLHWPAGNSGDSRWYEVQVIPLLDSGNAPLGVKVHYADVTTLRRVQEESQNTRQELETSREELQTTSEELQSTIEELETTNEELQSTNEELETMNEELQSTNEELRTMNDEMQRRGDELNQVNAFLESILTSLRAGVVVLDRDLSVLVWNHQAEDLWGLRQDEVQGTHFFNLDIGLPVSQLHQPIRACLAGGGDHQELVVEATNRRGKAIRCKLAVTPLVGVSKDIRGVILLMEQEDARPAGDGQPHQPTV
jgi:two-component system CheB/CheR fusion protein